MKRRNLIRRLAAAALGGLAALSFCLGIAAAEKERVDWDAFLEDPDYVVIGTSGTAWYEEDKGETLLGGSGKLPIYLYKASDYAENLNAEPLFYQELTATFSTPDAFLHTIPADYTNEYYRPETIGVDDDSFSFQTKPGSLGRAEGGYKKGGGSTDAMEAGEAYERIDWDLEYSYRIYIVCKADWPLEYCIESGGQIGRSPEYFTPYARDMELWVDRGDQLYESSLSGRRTIVHYTERDDSRIWENGVLVTDLVDWDNGISIGEIGGEYTGNSAMRDVRITDYSRTWDYTVIDELPHVPGFYAAICIHVSDSYSSMEAIGGRAMPEAEIIRSRYNTLVGEVTSTVPAAIAATQMKFAWDGQGEIGFIEQEDITDADPRPGEESGTEIDPDLVEGEGGLTPADIALILGGAVAGGAAAGLTEENGEEDEDEEPVPRSRYIMYVNKNFDNVLRIGDKPRAVYARIAEIPPGHGEWDRPDLTEKIEVFSGDGVLEVKDGGMSENGYKIALVTVPADCKRNEGEVSFRFTGKGGVYTRHVVFRLTELAIVFWQENLGLPRNHEDTERLPFAVLGLPEETMELEAEIKGSVYDKVELERDFEEKRFPLYYALIREKKPTRDPEKQVDPGTTETHILHIQAKSPSPFPREEDLFVEAKFPIHRVQMGLSLIMEGDAIGCYLKEKSGAIEQARMRAAGSELANSLDVSALTGLNAATAMASSGIAAMGKSSFSSNLRDTDKEPCVTEGRLMLLDWDKEAHTMIRVAVYPEETVTKATLMLNTKQAKHGEPDEVHQALVDKLEIKAFATNKVDERGRLLKFCSTKAGLDQPTRLRADVTIKLKFNKIDYEVTKNVLLHSMPIRHWDSDEEYRQMRQWDDHVTEYLTHVKEEIHRKYMYNLFSLHDLIERMLDGYDERFGYDGNQLDNVMKVWTGFLQGSFVGARAEAERVTLADDLAAAYAFLQGMRDNGGILGRIALGICTAGYSEYLFFAMDLGEKMKEAVFACKGDKDFGFWDGVIMGVKEYEKQLAMELLMAGALKFGNNVIGHVTGVDVGKTLQQAAGKYRAAVDAMDAALKKKSKLYRVSSSTLNRINRFFNKSARAAKDALDKEKALNDAANKKADTIARRRQGKTDMTPDELARQADYDAGMAEGMKKVRKMMEAQKELATARSSGKNFWECKAKYEARCRDVWLDKNALKQLKNLKHPYATNARAEFNAYRNRVKAETTEKLLDDIAAETGKRRQDLFIQSATSNDIADELAGRKVPEDWDVTVREHVNADPSTVTGKPVDGVYDVMPTALDPKQQVVMKQTASKNALARNLYKQMYGVDPPSLEVALQNLKDADVSYVAPWGDDGYVIEPNLEAYADLAGMIDKTQQGRELIALALNRKTFEYKGNEWYRDGDKYLQEALKIEAKAAKALKDAATQQAKDAARAANQLLEQQAKSLRYKAQACYVEGTRQITKQVTKIADPRNTYRMAKGAQDAFSANAREIHALALKVGDTMSPEQFFHVLRTDYGIDKYTYTKMMSECLV